MNVVLPDWLDQVQGVDFTPEKELLSNLEAWALDHGWEVTDGSNLPFDLARRTDIYLNKTNLNRHLRVAILPKGKKGPGNIRLDASTHRIFELVYQPKHKRWRVETASVPLSDDVLQEGWGWLENLAFRK